MLSLRAVVAGICAFVALATAGARADDPYYKGKRLTLLIGSAVGGPTDIEGRLFARYLGRHVDGQPSVVVQNKEGAGGVLGPTYLGEVGPKDGTMLGYFSGTAWNYVNNPEHWRVDLKSFEFVAYQSGTTIHFVGTDVPPGLKKPTDIIKAVGLVAGGTSMPGRLALQRGEIHMFSESPPSYRAVIEPALVNTGEVIPVWYDIGDASDDAIPSKTMEGLDIPSFPQLHKKLLGRPRSGQKWEAFRTIHEVNSTLQRLIVLPPGAPQVAIDALRAAVARLNGDQEFAAEAKKTIEFAPDYDTGADINERARSRLVASPEIRAFVADYIKSAKK
jgi:hypothetical protein